jgi:hypothetical protein
MPKVKKKVVRKMVFDPESSGYDYETAKRHGIKRNKSGHLPSRSPRTGQMLKGKRHPTWDKAMKGEKEAGFKVFKGANGRYYSKPKKGK